LKPATERGGHARQFLTGGFFLLALIVAVSVLFAARQRADDTNARNTMLTTNQLSALLSTMRQAESGVRGYLLTSNADSLQTYNMALTALPGELRELDTSINSGADAGTLAALHKLVAEKLAQLGRVLTLFESGDRLGAVAEVNIDLDLQTMQNLRSLIGSLQASQARLLAASEARDDYNGFFLQITTLVGVTGTLLLGSFAIRDNRLRTARLLEAEAALREANEALERRVEERTQTLRASETQFRTLAESLPGFVYITDTAFNNIYVNPQFAAYTGLPVAEILGQGWKTFMHPDDMQGVANALAEAAGHGASYQLECRLRGQDGAYRWFLARSILSPAQKDGAGTWIGTVTDINDRKRAEAEMVDTNTMLGQLVAERSRELDRIFRLSTDLLAVADFTGNYVSVSPAWEQITGRPIAEALASNYIDFLHPDHVEKAATDFAELRAGRPVWCENRYRRADGSYCWLSWRAVSMVEEQRIYAVARDITAEKDRDEQLRQSQKMEVVGQLTGGIAHDFNNLLTIIMGSLELLQRGMANADAKVTRRIDAAMEGARRAAALTHRLLAFARRQPLEPKAIEPNRLVAGMSDMLNRVLGEQIDMEFVSAAGLWCVQADLNQLENSILNLAVNARDAMPQGGHLTIETQNAFLDETYAKASADVTPGQYVMIAVTDTGTGMTPDVREKVFEPFFTTKPQGHGTGLGLAQVYGFIKQSNGHVMIYSEPGHGTSVKLYLPRLRGAVAEDARPAAPPPEDLASRGETILVVEDEENVRNFSVEVLEDSGYHVLAAENAAAALKFLDTPVAVDMLFTDVVLTGTMNGRLLADEFARRRPGAAVLFTTGYTRNAIIHHGRLDEGIEFIGKPFTASALTRMVRKVLDRNKFPAPPETAAAPHEGVTQV
jgi:PAS domain S-box-containing protein